MNTIALTRRMNMKIGIMGGTFNPIHLGHLILSEYIRLAAGLDKIIFIPTGYPPHKKNVLDGKIRLKMVDLAIEDNPYFISSDIEINGSYPSYTIDTIKELNKTYLNARLYMIIGSDSLFSLNSWKDYSKLLKQVNFIVADRFELGLNDVEKEIERLNDKFGSNIVRFNNPIIDISSTSIRHRVSMGLSIKYLVPGIVEDFIYNFNLYR